MVGDRPKPGFPEGIRGGEPGNANAETVSWIRCLVGIMSTNNSGAAPQRNGASPWSTCWSTPPGLWAVA